MYAVTIVSNKTKKNAEVIGLYADEKKAYIESLLYNISDLESIESIDSLESYDSKITNFFKAYLNEDIIFDIEILKQKLYTFSINFLRKLHKTSYEIQKQKQKYYVSAVIIQREFIDLDFS
jgi:hypothetical protein